MNSPHVGNFGNTRKVILDLPRVVPGKFWCFTLNNWAEKELETILKVCNSKNIKYLIGKEISPNTGTPHLQGFIKCMKKIRPVETFNNARIHWEKCKGDEEQNIKYCTKDNNFITNIKLKTPLTDPMKDVTWKDWQLKLVENLQSPPKSRTITWYYDKTGGIGKTTLCKHLCIKYQNEALYVSGKSADIKYAITKFLENKENELKYIFFDFTRDLETYISYEAIESIKNGIFFSGKYEGGMVMFNTPHVICFANFEPRLKAMSEDRWHIIQL